MGGLTAEQKALADSLVLFTVVFVYIVSILFFILLFIIVIKAIKYLNNKNKYNCATCKYKQRYNKEEIDKAMTITVSDDK